DMKQERHPFQQCYGDDRSSINSVDFVDGADVRVIQGRSGTGLTAESFERLWIVCEFFGKELQGDVATELEVFGLIHNAHATAADLAEYAVMGNSLPHGLGRSGHRREC